MVEDFFQVEHDNLALCPGITGPFTTTWLLMGYEQICFPVENILALRQVGREYGGSFYQK